MVTILFLQQADDIRLKPQGGENGISVIGNGAAELYHDNSLALTTISNAGIKITTHVQLQI